ncbi:MAG: hypothetical protein EPO55_11260 [Reyranella sp.]|uniref:hypothetical protein n=1 Tax=Reyranella sp. TaxID=1929291 RepID=UPI00121100CD|nr:hypothetical protein [Reyranella sp.]TAJ39750.1 MAG: hypothetical protein EPO55_11260 [Reyranella sp.]
MDPAIAPLGFVITGAKIRGNLDLRNFGTSTNPLPTLELSHCDLEGTLDLTDSCWSSVVLEGTSLNGLVGARMRLESGLRAGELQFGSPGQVNVDLQELQAGADVELWGLGRGIAGGTAIAANCTLDLRQCRIQGSLFLSGSLISNNDQTALSLDGASVSGNIMMSAYGGHEFEARGVVRLLGTKVGRWLSMIGAHINAPGHTALILVDCDIGNGLSLSSTGDRRFVVRGTVNITDAKIRGALSLEGALLEGSNNNALIMERAEISGSVFLRASQKYPFEARGCVRLLGAEVGGQLSCSGVVLESNSGSALSLEGATIGRNVHFRSRHGREFEARGELNLRSSKIEGSLRLSGAHVFSPKANALSLRNAHVGGDVSLNARGRRRTEFVGGIDAAGVHIGGSFVCFGARIDRLEDVAISLVSANVDGSISLKSSSACRFEVTGEISLFEAKVGGSLEFEGAKLFNDRGSSLAADGITVARDVFLRGDGKLPFEAVGTVKLIGAKIGGDVDLSHACLVSGVGNGASGDDFETALDLSRASIHDALIIELDRTWTSGRMLLTGTHVSELRDGGGPAWGPMPERDVGNRLRGVLLNLDGFVYDRVATPEGNHGVIGNDRIQWLERQYVGQRPSKYDFFPQPHEQLARVLRLSGHDEDSRSISINKFDHQNRCCANGAGIRILMTLFGLFFGYGHRPGRAVGAVALWVFIGWIGVNLAMKLPDPALVKATVGVEIVRSLADPDTSIRSPAFNPLRDRAEDGNVRYGQHPPVAVRDVPCTDITPVLYALDTMLPVVGLHMVDKCEISEERWGWRILRAVYSVLGWVIVAFAALTWTGVLRRESN